MVQDDERAKAAFLTDYRALCEKHGLMVVRVENPKDDYWPFVLARPAGKMLDIAIQEMLLEPVRTIVHEDA